MSRLLFPSRFLLFPYLLPLSLVVNFPLLSVVV